jgi:hypothetical protein
MLKAAVIEPSLTFQPSDFVSLIIARREANAAIRLQGLFSFRFIGFHFIQLMLQHIAFELDRDGSFRLPSLSSAISAVRSVMALSYPAGAITKTPPFLSSLSAKVEVRIHRR